MSGQYNSLDLATSWKTYCSKMRLTGFCVDTLRPQRCTRTFTAMALHLWPVGRHGEAMLLVGWDAKDVLGKFPRITMKHLTNILNSVCLVAGRINSIIKPL